jgi:uncharacterized phage protein (TIGR01671 family)
MIIMKEEIGLKDKEGTPIREGDIVEFFFDADYGHGDEESGFARMVDTVEKHGEMWYFMDHDIGCGAFAYRHNDHCRVIGNIHETANV